MNSTTENTEGLQVQFFGWLDFTLFILMLVFSTMIGIYFGFWGKKEDTPREYLHGGKTMSTIPVAVSLVARLVSLTNLDALKISEMTFVVAVNLNE
jgi:succinate dehydrogenase/fumarate reductase cytochrome b subunit